MCRYINTIKTQNKTIRTSLTNFSTFALLTSKTLREPHENTLSFSFSSSVLFLDLGVS